MHYIFQLREIQKKSSQITREVIMSEKLFDASHMAFTEVNSIYKEPNLFTSPNSWDRYYECLDLSEKENITLRELTHPS